MRDVVYYVYPVNIHGEEWGSPSERKGVFVAYTLDYEYAIIENNYGEIVKVPIDKFKFSQPQVNE